MKFSIEGVRDITDLVRQLSTGLYRLSFLDNFESFEVNDILVPANTEVSVENKLTIVPKKYIITFQKGNSLITAGDAEWTRSSLYIKNNGNQDVTVNVLFMR